MVDTDATADEIVKNGVHRREFLRASAGTALLGTSPRMKASAETTEGDITIPSLDDMDGEGSEEAPYVVTTVAELQAIQQDWTAVYELGADIDAAETADWNDGAGFNPIDNFTGRLNGHNHRIQELQINRPNQTDIGIFKNLRGTVRNLTIDEITVQGSSDIGALAGHSIGARVENVEVSGHIEGESLIGGVIGEAWADMSEDRNIQITTCQSNCRIRGINDVGGLVGRLIGGLSGDATINRCRASGDVTGAATVGGLVGKAEDIFGSESVRITNCISEGAVTALESPETHFGGLVGATNDVRVDFCKATGDVDAGTANQVGGLVGESRNPNSIVMQSTARCTVNGDSLVGGLVGRCSYSNIMECNAFGDVFGTESIGGVIGTVLNADVEAVYAAGEVTGNRQVGGVLGTDDDTTVTNHIERTLATGSITGDRSVGGIIGYLSNGTVTNSYWDTESTGQDSSPGLPDENGVPTAQLRGETARNTLEPFDFETVWTTHDEGYPRIQNTDHGITPTVDEAQIQNLRFVQTVENTRVLAEDATVMPYSDNAPVSEEAIRHQSGPPIEQSVPDPDFAARGMIAPVFDIRVDNPDGLSEPVTLTGRLYRNEELFREWTTEIAPQAVAGDDEARHAQLSEIWDLTVPTQLPLLETLVRNPDAITGTYPIFRAGVGSEFELEIEGPNIEPVTAETSIDTSRVRGIPSLTIGIVGLEGQRIDTDVDFSFNDEIDFAGVAEDIADMVIERFPNSSVITATREEPHHSYDGFSAPWSTAIRAADVMSESIDDAYVVRHTSDDRREITTGAVDVTVGVVPEGFFNGRTVGVMPTVDDRPAAAAVLVEANSLSEAPHELAHYFLGQHYQDQSIARNGTDQAHATDRMTSTGYALQDGAFDLKPGCTSMMSYNINSWVDAHTYQGLIDNRFRPYEFPMRYRAGQDLGSMLQWAREQRQSLESLSQSVTEHLSSNVDQTIDRLSNQIDVLAGAAASTGFRWDVPELPDPSVWEDLRDVADETAMIGAELQDGPLEFLDDTGKRTDTIGEQLEQQGQALRQRAEQTTTQLEDGVGFVLDIEGRIGEDGPDLRTDLVPTLTPVEDLDGEGTINVFDSDGTLLTEASAATEIEVWDNTGETTPVDDVLVGSVPVPEQAATVEVSVPSSANGRQTATINPVVDPIRDRIQGLPDTAFVDASGREIILESLDDLSTAIEDGDWSVAQEQLARVRELLSTKLRSDDEIAIDGFEKEGLLSLIDTQETRIGTPTSITQSTPTKTNETQIDSRTSESFPNLSTVFGGLTAGAAGLYLISRRWRTDRDSRD